MTFTLQIADEVAAAIGDGDPVVALETTLVSHGFSAGRGLEAAVEAEERVRAGGAVPATIGVIDGLVRVGLSAAELKRFADAGAGARKLGARDIAACVVQGALGATTVGGTLAVCRVAGLRFMATGGIGGVHRGFAESLDISADLAQIARSSAMVICSGAKSILDVPATSELLETLGVPVLGWRTPTLPLFYQAAGGPPVSAVAGSAAEAARIAAAHWSLAASGGLILARPPADEVEAGELIEKAVRRVRAGGVTGQAVTPAVLTLMEELTGGRSVEVNRTLIADNAGLAAEVAVAYSAGLGRREELAGLLGRPVAPGGLFSPPAGEASHVAMNVVVRGVEIPPEELSWRFSRASGPGGQSVNTTDSQAELSYDLERSPSLPAVLRERALAALAGRLTDGVITVTASEHRSQLRNREAATARLTDLLTEATAPPPPPRRPTRPGRAARERRLADKQRRSRIKRLRRPTEE